MIPEEADWMGWFAQFDRITVHSPHDVGLFWANEVMGVRRWTVWAWCGGTKRLAAWCDAKGSAMATAATLRLVINGGNGGNDQMRHWFGPWEQRWWSGLKGPMWLWRRYFLYPEGGIGVAEVDKFGNYSESQGWFSDITITRKEWMEHHGTPNDVGTPRQD